MERAGVRRVKSGTKSPHLSLLSLKKAFILKATALG